MPVVASGSKRFTVNFQPVLTTDHAKWVIEMFDTMTAAGWIAVDYSDGTTVTTSATPATESDIDNNNAWQRWKAPSGTFELWVQRGTNNRLWRMKFDPDGYNNDGAPTVPPTPTGIEINLIGQNGNFDTSYSGTNGQADTRRYHICFDSVAGQTGFYYFHIFQWTAGTGFVQRKACFSPLESGTFAVEDVAPWVSLEANNTGTFNDNVDWSTIYLKGLPGETLHPGLRPDDGTSFPSGGVVNPYNNKHNFKRAEMVDRTGGDAHFKGAALDVFLPASQTGALGSTDTLNLATEWGASAGDDPGALIRFDELLIPWPHGVTPII